MIKYKTEAEIALIEKSCALVSEAIAHVVAMLKEGITTLEIDGAIEKFIIDNGAKPAFKGYNGYPFASCISVNDTVVHGFPNKIPLNNGDVVSIDVGVTHNKFCGDSAYTFIIGDASEPHKLLAQRTKRALYKGIEQMKINNRVGDIAFAIQNATEHEFGYSVVRDLVGHGIGRDLHEDPQVPNFGKQGSGFKIQEGLVIAIEPMVNLGVREVFTEKDNWTIKTKDHKVSVHYEHTVAMTKLGAKILSSFDNIEYAIKKNHNLWQE